MRIVDGSGDNYSAKVTSKKRLYVDAVTHTSVGNAAEEGNLFTTGFDLTLTSDSQSAVYFLKNNGENPLKIVDISFGAGAMTGATDTMYKIQLFVNGTGLSASTATTSLNSNRGSSNTLDATLLQGQTGATVTDGVGDGTLLIPSNAITRIEVYFIIPRGQSIAFAVTPATGNTSFPITMYAQVYESED